MNLLRKPFGLFWVLFVFGFFPTELFATEVDATLQWVRTVSLSTTVSGVLAEVNVNRGDRVQAGQALSHLTDKLLQAEVVASKARLKKAENNRDEAQRELDRTQELYDRTLLSDHDLQLAIIQRDAAVAELQSAIASKIKAERELYYSVLRAPFDAWVLQRNAEPGQTVINKIQATPLIVLAEAGRMLARALVGREMLNEFKLGRAAEVAVGGHHYPGKIVFVAMEPAKPDGDHYIVDVIFNTEQQVLRVGQAATVKL